MVKLDGAMRLVLLQFTFSNSDAIPPTVKRRQPEVRAERDVRKGRSDGKLMIEHTERCSMLEFVNELEAAGYELVDAFHQARPARPDSTGPRYYHNVRFTFAHKDYVQITDEFRAMREGLRQELLEIVKTSLWRVRGLANPFYVDGQPNGQTVLSLNMEVREPLFRPDGTRVFEWPRHLKKKENRRPEDQPIYLQAKYTLHALGDTVYVMEAP